MKDLPASLVLPDLAALEDFGRQLGRRATPGQVICLYGPLGAGKTTLTRSFAEGLEVPASQPVSSPTFALIHEHQGRLPLYHLDLYRLHGDEEELRELGLEEYLYGEGVCVVEWPEKLGRLRPDEHLEIRLDFVDEPDAATTGETAGRTVTVQYRNR